MNQFKITVNGNEYFVNVESIQGNSAQVEVNGLSFEVGFENATGMTFTAPSKPAPVAAAPAAAPAAKPAAKPAAAPAAKPAVAPAAAGSGSAVKSPLPGVIVGVNVKVGDAVKSGQHILTLEAMKMENNINADKDGTVIEIKVNQGDSVLEGADLIIIG